MGNNNRARKQAGNDDRPAIWTSYGKLVKLFRERAGITQQQLADQVGYSYEQVASVEQGRRPAKATFTKAAERVLEAGGVLWALQEDVDLARLPLFFRSYALMEADALSLFWYGGYVIPGLLQTEDYARALLMSSFPPLDEETVEERLAARMDRQALLIRKKPPFVAGFVLEEIMLRRLVGGGKVMKAQLIKLLERMELRNVQIQIMPTAVGGHCGLDGSMVLLETSDHAKVAYIESQDASTPVISAPDKVSEFWMRHGMLRSMACNIEESARLIERIVGEL